MAARLSRRRSHPAPHEFWRFNWLAHHKRHAALARVRSHASGVLVDLGCGDMPFAPLFDERVTRYIGTDLPGSPAFGARGPHVYASAAALPLRADSADTLLAMALMSYLPAPAIALDEARRVLRPGGVLIAEWVQMSPLWQPPHDYWRFTRFGAERLLVEAGFEVVQVETYGGLMARVGLSWIAAINRINRGPLRPLTEIPARILYAAIQLSFEGLDRLCFDAAEPLAHLIVARKRSGC
ncbi:MAG: methyltransferase domain-containing protein [Candidatus Eisenbacteria bacterium]|uniref:Methyltransferase domain-containing protein n=1 Tax=Eiseniibacteriota bacterium TaxID=2212470 RepID=A0A849SNR1_UNCEI|nr:methyltransferase domain-containing protein [Candidatus Eisenbacteria bacterium]